MARIVTIVMYHYVRDRDRSRYPAIAALTTRAFEGQLAYLLTHHHVVCMEDVIAAALDPAVALPAGALLLTFDDGYAEHHDTVVPILERLGVQGSFFVPARPVLERRVLDVNKVHFVLAAAKDFGEVARALEAGVEAARRTHRLAPAAHYREAYARPNRWDPAEVVYVKLMLQKALPAPVRAAIADALFQEFVTTDERAFAEELYVSLGQLRRMRERGMHVGGHGYDHAWFDTLDGADLEHEIQGSLRLLKEAGGALDGWAMAYPYGAFDASALRALRAHRCRVGLTIEAALADLDDYAPLTLPRIDTNDLPTHADAEPCDWTRAALREPGGPASRRRRPRARGYGRNT